MPHFLIEASYSAEGLRGLAKDKASGREAAVKTALASVGGKLISIYYALGKGDVYIVCECRPSQRGGVVIGRFLKRPHSNENHFVAYSRGNRSRAC